MTDFQYSAPGSPGAVDAGQIVVCAWHKGATVELKFTTGATLRALAAAIYAGNHERAFTLVGRDPFNPLSLELTRGLLRDRAVAAALTQTLALSDAEDLRDALTTAIDELETKPSDDFEEQR